MKQLKSWLLCAALTLGTGWAAAQDIAPAQVASAGADVIKILDESRYGELWNGASLVIKQLFPRAQFGVDLAKIRQPFGAPSARTWVSLSHGQLNADQGQLAGEYANVEYETRFAKGEVKRELVSFRLDTDKVWRFAGYALR